MKLLLAVLGVCALLAAACGSGASTKNANLNSAALATPPITPVATTLLGTPRPGQTPRPTPASAGIPPLPASAQPEQSLPDGLKYTDITVGTGPAAQSGQPLVVNYTGWLQNGTMFDSSIGKQPFSFTLGVGNVIKGWDEGLVGMKVGGKRRLIVPPALGYGATANGKIPANSTLTFDVDLLSAGGVSASPTP